MNTIKEKEIRILILEDVLEDLELVTFELKKNQIKFKHLHVETEQEFRKGLLEFEPDLIFSDYNLPQYNGMEALTLVKEISPSTPLIIITGSINEEIAVECIKAGATDYILKENLNRLGSALKSAMEKKAVFKETQIIQEALHISEEKFRSLFENANIGIYRTTPDGKIIVANPALVKMLGYNSFEELANCNLETGGFVSPGSREKFKDSFKNNDNVKVHEAVWQKKDGSSIYIRENATAIRNKNGDITYYDGTVEDISKGKQAEETLRTSEAQLSNAMKIARLGYWEYDVETDLFKFNDHFYNIFRTTAEKVGGYTISPAQYARQFVHPDDISVIAIEMKKALETNDPNFSRTLEHRIIYADGEPGYISVRFHIVKDDKGRTIKTYGANQDITKRKQAEETLKSSEKKLKKLIDDDLTGDYITSIDGRILLCNPALVKILGFGSVDELMAENIISFYKDPNSREQLLNQVREKKKIEQVEKEFILRNGRVITVIENVVGEFNGNGELISLNGYIFDITDRKQAEAELINSEEKYKIITQSSIDIIFILDKTGKLLFLNESVTQILGYQQNELVGKSFRHFVPKKEIPKYLKKLADVFKYKEIRDFQTQIYHKDKHLLDVEINGKIIRHEGKLAAQGAIRDISLRKQVEDALRESKQVLEGIINAIPARVFWKNENLVYLGCNKIFANDAGLTSPDQIIGKDDYQMDWRDQADLYRTDDRQVIESGSPKLLIEEQQTTPDGKTITLLTNKIPLLNAQGQTSGVLGTYMDISERKRVEEELREKDRIYKTLLNNLPGFAYRCQNDKNWTMNYISMGCKELTGYLPEDFINNKNISFNSIIDKEYQQKLWDTWQVVLKKKTIFEYEYPIRTKSQKVKWIWERGCGIYSDDGKVQYLEGFITDITERKRAEMIQNAQYNIASIMARAVDLGTLFAIIKNELSLFMNIKNLILLCYYEETGRVSTFNNDPNLSWQVENSLSGLVISGKETTLLRKKEIKKLVQTGKIDVTDTIPEVWLGVPLVANGKVIGVMEIQDNNQSDVYDKSTVEMLEMVAHELGGYISNKEIESERERLNMAIEQSAESVVITDPQGNIQYVNPAFEKITGYSRSEILGQSTDILNSGQQQRPFLEEMWNTISAGHVWHGKMVNRKKDGSLFTEEGTISPVFDSDGKISNYVSVKRDVTKEEILGQQLLQAQKMESIGRLAGGVAHDFNNMLSVIMGYSELALMSLSPSDKLYNDIQEINKAGQRSADLTTQLLAFSRKQTITPKVLNLNDSISNILKMLQRLIGENIELAWLPAAKPWPVKIDPIQIDQILANLCVNARDAIDGSGKLTIQTTTVNLDEAYCTTHLFAKPGNYMMLSVSDDGFGMDKETLTQVYEPFFTTKAEGEGTGLGLATVYGIVKQNGGLINIYSEPQHGTTIRIYIPRDGDTEFETIQEKPVDIPMGHGETVLVVEDEIAILEMVRTMLEQTGYEVITANTPTDALSLALAQQQSPKIELLMTDVVMAGMSGKELAGQLNACYPEIKVLFMSGYTSDVIAHSGILENGVNFINKPFSRQELAVKMQDVFNQ